jgi:hypothetical protein
LKTAMRKVYSIFSKKFVIFSLNFNSSAMLAYYILLRPNLFSLNS